MAGGAVRAGKAVVELGLVDRTRKKLRSAQRRLKAFGGQVNRIGASLGKFAVLAAAPIGFAVKTFADFSDKMSEVGAVTGSTSSQLAMLTGEAKRLGAATSFTASEVAALQTELGRAGVKPGQIMDATEAILNLGRATGTDLAEAATIAAGTMNGFGLEASDMVDISNVLTATANRSANTLQDIGEAMAVVAKPAQLAGDSMRDMSAIIGVLGNNMIKGSAAGTALRNAFARLGGDTNVQKTLKDMTGISAVEGGKIKPLMQIFTELGGEMEELSEAKKIELFSKVFGLRSATAAAALSTSVKQLAEMRGGLEDVSGVGKATAEMMDDNLGGAFRKFGSAVESIKIAFAEALEGPFIKVTEWLTEVARNVTTFLGLNKKLTLIMVAVVAGMATLAGGLLALGVALHMAAFAVGGLILVMSGPLAPLALLAAVTVAAVAGVAAWLKWSDAGKKAVTGLKNAFGNLGTRWKEIWKGIKSTISDGRFQDLFALLGSAVELAWVTMLNLLIAKLNVFSEKIGQVAGIAAAFMARARGLSAANANLMSAAVETQFEIGMELLVAKGLERQKEVEDKLDKEINDPRNAVVRPPEPGKQASDGDGDAGGRIADMIAGAAEKMQVFAAGGATAQLSTAAGMVGHDMQGEIREQTKELKKQTRLLDDIDDNLDGDAGGLGA